MVKFIDPAIKAVLLDAVGTTIHPAQDVCQTYLEFGRRNNSRLSLDEIQIRFRKAFHAEEEVDRVARCSTSAEREKQRWQEVVARVFDDLEETQTLFQMLWEYYGEPSSWRVFPKTVKFLDKLRQNRVQIVLASNFDSRLRNIVQGLPELAGIERLAISSEIGWKKPSPEFYRTILEQLGMAGHEVISVGDDCVNDVQGARAAGLRAELIQH